MAEPGTIINDGDFARQVERVFHDLADASKEARANYFATHRIDPAVRSEVDSLLSHDLSSTTVLASRVCGMAAAAVSTYQPYPSRQPLRQCGPYQLLDVLGRGGMGTVYRAKRIDDEIQLFVAVKLMHSGSDDAITRRRFLQERQILANLQHQNIAGFIDAGHAEDGQPYFVIELIEGQRVDEFCKGLTVRRRIELFLQICDAVSFAHSRLIVHRDLKPGNILVTAGGVPKLLDFGIAKMLDLSEEETATWGRVLTPSYASPEQVRGAGVTTATDIYSLGAVLYRLLTGRSPHQMDGATNEDRLAAVCEREPEPASTLNHELSGDLDAILQKAMRKDPQQRYATVNQLSEDLWNHLERKPVRARDGEYFYSAVRFVSRHWMVLTAALVTITVLSVSLIITQRERRLAERRFQSARTLANKLFEVDNRVRVLPGSTGARQYIADTELKYLNELSEEASERDLLLELGEAYGRTASVLSSRREASLGRDADALAALDHGSQLLRSALAAKPGDKPALRVLVRNRREALLIKTDKNEYQDLGDQAHELSILVNDLAHDSNDAADLSLATTAYASIRRAFSTRHQLERARPYADLTIEFAQRNVERNPGAAQRLQYSAALRQYGTFRRQLGELEQGLAALQKAEEVLSGLPRDHAQMGELSVIFYYIGLLNAPPDQVGLGDTNAAIPALESSIELSRRLMAADAKDHNVRIDFAQAMSLLAEIQTSTEAERAARLYEEALAVMSAEPAGSFLRKEYLLRMTSDATFALRNAGRTNEAYQRLLQAQKLMEQPGAGIGTTSPESDFVRATAEFQAAEGRSNAAIAEYQKLLHRFAALNDYHPFDSLIDAAALSRVDRRLAQLRVRTHDITSARAAGNERRELWRHWAARLPGNTYVGERLAEAEKEFSEIR